MSISSNDHFFRNIGASESIGKIANSLSQKTQDNAKQKSVQVFLAVNKDGDLVVKQFTGRFAKIRAWLNKIQYTPEQTNFAKIMSAIQKAKGKEIEGKEGNEQVTKGKESLEKILQYIQQTTRQETQKSLITATLTWLTGKEDSSARKVDQAANDIFSINSKNSGVLEKKTSSPMEELPTPEKPISRSFQAEELPTPEKPIPQSIQENETSSKVSSLKSGSSSPSIESFDDLFDDESSISSLDETTVGQNEESVKEYVETLNNRMIESQGSHLKGLKGCQDLTELYGSIVRNTLSYAKPSSSSSESFFKAGLEQATLFVQMYERASDAIKKIDAGDDEPALKQKKKSKIDESVSKFITEINKVQSKLSVGVHLNVIPTGMKERLSSPISIVDYGLLDHKMSYGGVEGAFLQFVRLTK